MEQISFKDKKAIFDRLEKMAKKANMTPEERRQYEEEWKIYNDYFNTIESAEKKGYIDGIEEGRAEGREEGRAEGREEGRAEGREEGRAEGREEGREKGREEEKQANARNMKAMNFAPDIISQITGLTIEEIEKL